MSPAITVVMVVGRQRVRARAALASILGQSNSADIEVLLYDFAGAEHSPLPGADAAQVTVIPGRGLPGAGLVMAAAVFQAQAPIVAFMEEHTVLLPGWGEAMVRAFAGPWGAVGPEMLPGSPGQAKTDLIDAVSFGPWTAPARRGVVRQLRWQNIAYRRSALLRYGPNLPWLFMSEGTLFQQLQADGFALLLEPQARMRHFHERQLIDFFYGNIISNWRSAAARAHYLHYNGLDRLLRVASAMAGAVRNPWRLATTLRRSPEHSAQAEIVAHNLPWVIAYYAGVSCGMILGYLLGLCGMDQRFMDYEINRERILVFEVQD